MAEIHEIILRPLVTERSAIAEATPVSYTHLTLPTILRV